MIEGVETLGQPMPFDALTALLFIQLGLIIILVDDGQEVAPLQNFTIGLIFLLGGIILAFSALPFGVLIK